MGGGPPIVVRDEAGAEEPVVSSDGSTLYYALAVRSAVLGFWGADREIRCATPESGPSRVLAYVPGGRIPDHVVLDWHRHARSLHAGLPRGISGSLSRNRSTPAIRRTRTGSLRR